MRASYGWYQNYIEEYPGIHASALGSNGLWYLSSGEVGGEGDDRYSTTIIEVQPDGQFVEYLLGEYSVYPKSMVAIGNKIVMTTQNTGYNKCGVAVFNVDTKVAAYYESVNHGGNSYAYGGGAVGPDGLAYFAPIRDYSYSAPMKPLVYNPVTNAVTFDSFNDTWVTDHYGEATMGGDGLMYFTPGWLTAAGGGYSTGDRTAVVDFTTRTVSYIPNPQRAGYSAGWYEDTVIWAETSSDGIYAWTNNNAGYRVSLANGWELFAFPEFWDEDNAIYPPGEITERPDIQGIGCKGPDGRFYAFGYTYRGSYNYSPVLMWWDPADDIAHYYEYPSMSGHVFLPSVTVPHGEGMIALRLEWDGWDPWFKSSIPKEGPPGVGGVSYARGSTQRSLAIGSTMVTGKVG